MLQLDVKARARRANRRGDRPAVDLRRGDLLVSARIEPATLGASRSLGMALIQDVLPDVAGVKVIRVSSITPGAPLAASGVLVGWRMVAVSLGGDEREPIHTIHSALVTIRGARAEGVPFTLWFEAPEDIRKDGPPDCMVRAEGRMSKGGPVLTRWWAIATRAEWFSKMGHGLVASTEY